MDRIRIRGGNKLNGTIEISGAKNAALPLMITALLTPDQLTLHNVPRLVDVQRLQKILGKPRPLLIQQHPMNSSRACGPRSGSWAP
jgi:UDP-N-acetylglucosamine enolpyruvyl transferase